MNTMIDVTEQPSHSFVQEEVVLLLNQKIEDSVINQKPVIIGISNSVMECRNTIDIDDYEIDNERLYLNSGNFELHIQIVKITKNCNELEEQFICMCNNVEVVLYFSR